MAQLKEELVDSEKIIREVENSEKEGDEIVHLSEFSGKGRIVPHYPIGLSMFDEAMEGGFKDGDLVIISGISGQGKTTLAQTLTYNLCKNGTPTLWFSYEVSREVLHNKFMRMGINDFYHIFAPRKNTTGQLEWVKQRILHAMVKCRTKVIFIDHIDFLRPTQLKSSDNESLALKNICVELKALAIDYKITIVLMAHLKKLADDFVEPSMQDIGYSAGIFQLADYVYIIWRLTEKKSKLSSDDTGMVFSNYSKIKLIKNRSTGKTLFQKVIFANDKFSLEDNFHEEIIKKFV